MKVTSYEIQLWEKLLLQHKLLSKPQIDASIAAWRAQPATSTLTLGQMFEKQGVKPNHVKQLADHIAKAVALALQQAAQRQATSGKTGAPVAPPAQAAKPPAPAAQPAKPAAPSPNLPVIEGISDADLSIEGLDLPPAQPAPPAKPAPTPAAKPAAAAPAPAASAGAPAAAPAGSAPKTGQAFVPPPGALAAKAPIKLEDPVLAPKFAGNEDLMPNESDDVRWTPSEAEWVDDIKTDKGPQKSDIPQIDLLDDSAEGDKPRPKIFKQDDAKEWYGAIGNILNSAGEKKSDDIPILDFDGTLEEPNKSPENKPKITHSTPSIAQPPKPEIKKGT